MKKEAPVLNSQLTQVMGRLDHVEAVLRDHGAKLMALMSLPGDREKLRAMIDREALVVEEEQAQPKARAMTRLEELTNFAKKDWAKASRELEKGLEDYKATLSTLDSCIRELEQQAKDASIDLDNLAATSEVEALGVHPAELEPSPEKVAERVRLSGIVNERLKSYMNGDAVQRLVARSQEQWGNELATITQKVDGLSAGLQKLISDREKILVKAMTKTCADMLATERAGRAAAVNEVWSDVKSLRERFGRFEESLEREERKALAATAVRAIAEARPVPEASEISEAKDKTPLPWGEPVPVRKAGE